jgi:mycofactocin precursor
MEKVAMDTLHEEKIRSPDSEEEPMILEEIDIEELFIDGICGVY